MRRMHGPPMRGRDMDPRDMRGREPNRDFFRSGEQPDFSQRRQYEGDIRDRLMNSAGFPGPGRNPGDMGGRGMPPREQNSRFMDMRDRDTFHNNMPRFNNPNMEGRRGFPMERHDGFRDMHNRPPMDMVDAKCYDMDMPPYERRNMDSDRRGGPPFNPRGGFNSDMDFRNRPGPSAEFRGRERSPIRFGNSEVPPVDRTRSDMPANVSGPDRSEFMGAKEPLREQEYPEASNSPLMDYRCGEEMTLAEEWKSRQKDKPPFLNMSQGLGGMTEPSYPGPFGRNLNIADPSSFQERDRPPLNFQGKDGGFPHSDRFPAMELPSIVSKASQDHRLSEMSPLTGNPVRENENKRWLGERELKHSQNESNRNERPYHQEKKQPTHEMPKPNDCFEGLKELPHSQGPPRSKMGPEGDFQSSNTVQVKDQDYRDIDYRTGSGRAFDYKQEEPQAPEKLIKESKPIINESGSQDQDYRSASLEDKVSNTISVMGIPKTATMEQILGAFTVRDGVPIQGMKIQNVVPGYSYDTAYVEFLNLEDAVHFMESNKGSLKVGARTVSMRYFHPDKHKRDELEHKLPPPKETQLSRPDQPSEELNTGLNGSEAKGLLEPPPNAQWQRSSDLTPEAWQQQVDQQRLTEQQAEASGKLNPPGQIEQKADVAFKDSKTMIIKNVKVTTTVETILKALDPFAYLDERNVRLVKAKPNGGRCFCFVDMDSHEQVTRLVELLTKPKPLYIDGVRVYAEVAKPLKNQNVRRDFDKQTSSILGYPPDANVVGGTGYDETPPVDPSYSAAGLDVTPDSAELRAAVDGSQMYSYNSETPDISNYLYDATSGFYYDPETTLYYDPNSRYFYNAQSQEYLYWDTVSKTYIPVPGGTSTETQPMMMTAEDQAILSNPAADAPLEMKKPSVAPFTAAAPVPSPASAADSNSEPVPNATATPDKKEEDDTAKKEKEFKEDKPRSLAAVKIMKDMERWAKIQNRQKDSVRSPSPLLKSGMEDDRRQSKSADAGFAIFERKNSIGDDLFKKPLAPPKKDEKSKRPMGSLGMLASDYAAGSDEEVEEDKEEAAKSSPSSQSDGKDDKLTDWKKMACLLCRRQFPNKDALIRHQQLSDLHKQNMEIHLKIKRSKKELEALENQEKELNVREVSRSPEQKRKKSHHQQPQHHNSWAGSSREANKVSERPGLGAEPVPVNKRQKKEVWDHHTYKQAVRKAMFARFKELE
ncbi:RNA-binding protein 5-like [Lampetra planeri]